MHNAVNGWALIFLIRGFGLSKKWSIEVGFAFSIKALKSQDLRFRMTKKKYMLFILFQDFRFGLCIFTPHLTELALCSGDLINVIFHVEKPFLCQICGKYAKITCKIIQKGHIFFLLLHSKS